MPKPEWHDELDGAARAAAGTLGKEFTARFIPCSADMQPRPFHQIGQVSGTHMVVEDDEPDDGGPRVKFSFYKPVTDEECRGCPYQPPTGPIVLDVDR